MGKNGEGLVFWPRTLPSKAGNFEFEFVLDGRGQKLSMPLVFVDNAAADSPETLATLCDYYNNLNAGLPTFRQSDFAPEVDVSGERIINHGGVARRYAPEVAEGDTSYETLYWVIGAEGRRGRSVSRADDDLPDGIGQLRKDREAEGLVHDGFVFGPLLVADDQPPFYPFVQCAVLRLDRIGRLLGERRGMKTVATFDLNYLKNGLPDPDPAKAEGPGGEGGRGPMAFMNLLTEIMLDAGNKGDRIGAIGRPSGQLAALSRREGPLTLSAEAARGLISAGQLTRPPLFSDTINPQGYGERLASLDIGGMRLTDVQFAQSNATTQIKEVLTKILGADDCKILGVFKLTEIIDFLLCNLEEHVPLIRETLDYAEQQAGALVELVRQVSRELLEVLDEVDEIFTNAAADFGGGRTLELRRVYPEVASGVTRLRVSLSKIERSTSNSEVTKLIPELPAAGKALVSAIDDVARDPISPLKLELQRLFLSELQQIAEIYDAWNDFVAITQNPNAVLSVIEDEFLDSLQLALVNQRQDVITFVMAMAPFDKAQELVPDATSPVRTALEQVEAELAALVGAVFDAAVTDIFVHAPNADNPGKAVLDTLDEAISFGWLGAVRTVLETAAGQDGLIDRLEDALQAALDEVGDSAFAPPPAYLAPMYRLVQDIKAFGDTAERAQARIDDLQGALDELGSDAQQTLVGLRREMEQRVAADLDRLIDALLDQMLGINRRSLVQSINVIAAELRTIQSSAGRPERQGQSILSIFAEVDRLFFNGSYAAQAKAELGDLVQEASAGAREPLRVFVTATLDVYEAALNVAAAIAEGTSPPEVLDAAAFLEGLAEDVSAFVEVAAFEALKAGDEAAIESVNEARAVLDARFAELQGASLADLPYFDAVNTLVSDLLAAQHAFFARGLEVPEAARPIAGRYAAELFAFHQPAVDALAGVSNATGKAMTAFAAFDVARTDAQAAIDSLRVDLFDVNVTPDALLVSVEALATTFPRSETVHMLEAWPRMLLETVALLENMASRYDQMAARFASQTYSEDTALLGQTVTDALEDLKAETTAAYVSFAAHIQQNAMDLYRALARTADVADVFAVPHDARFDAVAQAYATARAGVDTLNRRLDAFDTQYPFFAPVTTEARSLIDNLTRFPAIERDVRRDYEPLLVRIAAFRDAQIPGDKRQAARDIVEALENIGQGNPIDELLMQIQTALGSRAGNIEASFADLRTVAIADAASALAALENAGAEVASNLADQALGWAVDLLLPRDLIDRLFYSGWQSILRTRNDMLTGLASNRSTVDAVLQITKFLGIGVSGAGVDLRHVLVAVEDTRLQDTALLTEKDRLLEPANLVPPPGAQQGDLNGPRDLLHLETSQWFALSRVDGNAADRVAVLRAIYAKWQSGGDHLAILQVVDNAENTLESVARADLSNIVDFSTVRDQILERLRELIPNKVSVNMALTIPVTEFRGIFIPVGQGQFELSSNNTIELADALPLDGKPSASPPKVDANASARLSQFDIKLLGSFDAITISFSEARMDWQLGKDPSFDLEFIGYEIGKELDFVQQLAQSLSASAGGAYVRPARGMLGIEAGYGMTIPAINLGGVTFMNVGLAAFARLPFDKNKAQLGASLSSRKSPFVILAGIWGGGGHFTLTSDGRRITTFDASFVYGGGGAAAYGPLVLQARASIGVFCRKVGSFTEISGDFFAGGSGKIAIFAVSATLTVTLGMDSTGAMVGSAVFRFSFSVGFAKIRYSITLFKKEGKGFEGGGSDQMAQVPGRYRIAGDLIGRDAAFEGWESGIAEITVDTSRQDQNYDVWSSYFSSLRPLGY
ncbi:MAG: hypothetical protein V2I76_13415 [Roseobacter sp.]|nr:hypothetical protein [Roseobacter sp.]